MVSRCSSTLAVSHAWRSVREILDCCGTLLWSRVHWLCFGESADTVRTAMHVILVIGRNIFGRLCDRVESYVTRLGAKESAVKHSAVQDSAG
jgi:hypothetical protein